MARRPLRVGSTFSGVGGADLGLERAGFELAWTCEWDEWKRSVLAAHWPDVPHFVDVRDLAVSEDGSSEMGRVPGNGDAQSEGGSERAGTVDLLVGGFPCQDLSVAGKRRGFGGERSVLAFEFLRIAESLRPRWLLMENVPGLLSSNGGRDMARLLDEVGAAGYGWAYRVLDARYFGVPQRRRRVFIVARRADSQLDFGDASALALRALWEGGGGDPTPGWPPRQDTPADAGVRAQSGGRESDVNRSITSFYSTGGSQSGFARQDGVSPTIKRGSTLDIASPPAVAYVNTSDRQAGGPDDNSTQANHLVPDETTVRRLTPIECERLMGWPDGWTAPEGVKAPDSKRYAACGDGIVSWVAYWIGCRIRMIEEQRICEASP